MTLPSLFIAYLLAIAGAAMLATWLWLKPRASVLTIAFLAVWLAYAACLGITGVVGRIDHLPPGIAFLTVPVVVTILVTVFTSPGTVLVQRLPIQLLLGFQLFRVGVELTLHHLWSIGLAPRLMTLEGGNIEILVALTAPVAAWLVSRGAVGRRIAWMWNWVGLLSLANIVTRAVLSAPGPFQLLHADRPDVAILIYPFTFIPGFMAPLAMALHVLAFRAFAAGNDAASQRR
jgi:hypothetical protein